MVHGVKSDASALQSSPSLLHGCHCNGRKNDSIFEAIILADGSAENAILSIGDTLKRSRSEFAINMVLTMKSASV